jgi:hypothetical protein
MQARPTVCYYGETNVQRYPNNNPSPGGELCASEEIGAKTTAVYGGGIGFFGPEGADQVEDTWDECNYHHSSAKTSYVGFIKPCAPGGPSGWIHSTTHTMLWRAGSGYGYAPFEFRSEQKHLPLDQSTCPSGGGGGGGISP